MSIIIFEAPDNCGKTTQIKLLNKFIANNNENVMNLHCMTFGISDNKVCEDYSREYYRNLMDVLKTMYEKTQYIILDRSWLGELIYGPIYRDYNGGFVLNIEKEFMEENKEIWEHVCLISITDTPERIIARDDGDSFSTDVDVKKREILHFLNAHRLSNIYDENKLLIDMKEGMTIDEVHKAITRFLF